MIFGRRKRFTGGVVLALVLVVLVGTSGCTEQEQSTTTGALIGAGLGAVIGNQSGKAVEGALIGAAVGGAIGYIVGESRTQRIASADQTYSQQGYRAVEGLQIKITEASVSPTVARPGDDVDLNSTVAVMGPGSDPVKVRQRIAIYKGQELVGDIIEDQFDLEPGTHRISRRITLQKDFPAGRYLYVTHVKAYSGDDVSESSREVPFSVG
ncbi:MAG: glycine zipper 2TM domain-containing protein [Candidatus Hydrogenedentota bacterium]|nr:MAG: glycine zipper 2TM domain-containing protein [Candidatus Hydrogenedentota bacterium]